jgi:putative ABC transport system permease protein
MNILQLVIKQMRQRALSTWLTMLSVLLGVGLGSAIMILQRGAGKLFGQTDYGFDVLIGAKGSPLQLTLNTVYQLDRSPGNIPYSLYEQLMTQRKYRALIRLAVPTAVGDTYQGQRIVATLPKLFGFDDEGNELPEDRVMEYRPGRRYAIEHGRVFHPRKFEAIVGSDIPQLTGLDVGGRFQASHGMPTSARTADVHEEQWTVVGRLAPTHTASDRVIYIPLITFYTIAEHEQALTDIARLHGRADAQAPAPAPAPSTRKQSDGHEHEHGHEHQPATTPAGTQHAGPEEHVEHEEHAHHDHYTIQPDGTIDLKLPEDQWMLSAIMVRTRGGGFNVQSLVWDINNQNVASAVNPASEMQKFFDTFLQPSSKMLQAVSYLVTVVAAVGILVSIYNSISARRKEIAILRALGATRSKILTLICLEAGLIGLIGAAIGLVLGHVLGAVGSQYVQRLVGEGFDWLAVARGEWLYLIAVVVLAVLAGLVPALKAYRTPVATNLVSG